MLPCILFSPTMFKVSERHVCCIRLHLRTRNWNIASFHSVSLVQHVCRESTRYCFCCCLLSTFQFFWAFSISMMENCAVHLSWQHHINAVPVSPTYVRSMFYFIIDDSLMSTMIYASILNILNSVRTVTLLFLAYYTSIHSFTIESKPFIRKKTFGSIASWIAYHLRKPRRFQLIGHHQSRSHRNL